MSNEKVKLGECDKGDGGTPGTGYSDYLARVYRLRPGRYELYVRIAHGSNQGYREEHHRKERTYRAGSVDDLCRIGISEVRSDDDLGDDGRLAAAIREACFEAEDAEAAIEAASA